MRDIVLMKLMGHADFATTQKYYIFVSDARKKQEYEQAWGLVPTSNNNTINSNILNIPNADGIDPNTIIAKEFEQLQKIWIQTLVASTILQKNNTLLGIKMVHHRGIEPRTSRLRVCCSAN